MLWMRNVDQSPLAGALKNAGFKIREKNFGQEVKTSNCIAKF